MKQARQRLGHYKDHPVDFVKDVFKVTPEIWQAEALTALAEEDRVSIASGHGVGKSAFDVWAILWFMSTRYPCKVPLTAPTGHQLNDVLMSEMGLWYRKMDKAWQEQFILKTERLEIKGAENTSFCVARTSRKEQPEALQGFHSPNLLFVIDEASGVDDLIFEVAEGALSSHNAKVIMTSNPTRTSGYFYDSHHKMRHRWHTMSVSCGDSTQVDPQYVEDMKIKYGEDSNVFRVRCLGKFPLSDEDCVIPLSLVEAAAVREVKPIETIYPVWGLDVARYGKCKTALVKRWSNHVLEAETLSNRDTMEVAGWVMHQYEETENKMRPAAICVDSIGLGAGVADRLRELGLPVIAVNVAEAPSGRGLYANYRAELWWRAREWLEDRDSKIINEDLMAELTCVTYKYTSSGKIQIESKHEMMDRGVASPDLADAFVLTFSGADRRREHGRYKRRAGAVLSEVWAA